MEDLRSRGKPIPALFRYAAGLLLESVSIHVMHTCGQGFCSHVVGNIMNDCLLANVFCGGGKNANLDALNEMLIKLYKDTKEPTHIKGKLTFDRIKGSKQWPKLKSKAAGTRHLATIRIAPRPDLFRLPQKSCAVSAPF